VLYYGWHWTVITAASLAILAATFFALTRYQGTRAERMTVTLVPARAQLSPHPDS